MTAFTVSTEKLLAALKALQPLVPKKPSRDILSGIKLSLANVGTTTNLILEATDLETFARAEIEGVTLQNPGYPFVPPMQEFVDFVSTLDSPYVLIDADLNKEEVTVSDPSAEFKIALKETEDFPDSIDFNRFASGGWFTLELQVFEDLVRKSVFSAASEGHPRWGALSAISIEIVDNKIAFVGTDQHRASFIEVPVASKVANKSILLPAKTIALLPKTLNGQAVEINLSDPNVAVFRSSELAVTMRLMAGNFPPVRKIIPQHTETLSFDVRALQKQTKKVALASDSKNSSLRLEFSKDLLSLVSKTRHKRKSAKAKYQIDNNRDIVFALNCDYFLDLLKAADPSKPLQLFFNKNTQPLLFKQDEFMHVMVPQGVV